MSTRKGSTNRERAQKYKNRTAFKNDLHDKTPAMKMINSIQVSQVCLHCKSVIEWKIKYKKYKPLSQQKTCIKCNQRNIKKAYHVICADCSKRLRVCAKCLKSGEEVEIEPPQPTFDEQIKLKAEMDRLIKELSERKRRTFLRFMNNGKPEVKEILDEDIVNNEETVESDLEEEDVTNKKKKYKKNKNPYSRDELIKKIEELTLGEENDFDSESDLSESSDES